MRVGIRNTLAYTHVWVAIGAAVQVLFFGIYAQVPSQELNHYAWLIFFASLSFYSFHRLYSLWKVLPDLPDDRWKVCYHFQRILFSLVALGGLFALVLFLTMPSAWQVRIIFPAVLSTLYALPIWRTKRVRDFGSLKPLWLSVGWVWLCVLVPLSNSPKLPEAFYLLILERFLFILSLAIMSDNKDVAFDHFQGVETWSVKLGERPAVFLSVILCMLSLFVSIKVVLEFSGHGAFFFVLPITSILAIVLYAISAIVKRENHLYYTFFLDGLLLLPILVLLPFWNK